MIEGWNTADAFVCWVKGVITSSNLGKCMIGLQYLKVFPTYKLITDILHFFLQ